jgi:DNA-binding PadR family transcriptional regulator
MYGAYLSFTQSNNYLDYLLSRGLIATEQRGGQPVYRLTERGLRVLQVSETMSDLLQPPSEDGNSASGSNGRVSKQQQQQQQQSTPSDKNVENKKALAQA